MTSGSVYVATQGMSETALIILVSIQVILIAVFVFIEWRRK